MTVSRFIEPKILWYSTSILLNTIEAQLLEIQAEGWKNCHRYSHTLPRCTCIAKMSTQLEPNQKSGPSDIIHLPYSGTPKMYSAHWLDCNSKMPVYVPTQYFYCNMEGTIRTASKIRSWQYRQCMVYSQDMQKGSTFDQISGIFAAAQRPGHLDVVLSGKIPLISSKVLPFCISWLYTIHWLYHQDPIFDVVLMVPSILR